ncbi:type IV toxin-antitoxin system AbiEi family antitoxin [Pedobacter arcticus]|uniref:type IV toxin-antitoxin system AbiEi family antitoxin n=1 Tax=Pedobacter arcticus TaxID=752140 RepID=UPI0002D2F2C2|nr:type IV toxin-antitoxin system AbiEi family antitoxin [Pedobacter arcticus]
MNHEHCRIVNMKEQETLQKAIEKLSQITDAKIKNKTVGNSSEESLEIEFKNHTETFSIQIRNELRAHNLPLSLKRDKKVSMPSLLISQYIPMPIKQELKKKNVNYLEVAGNCFISTPKIFIYINDQQVTESRISTEGKLWKPAGLKFTFAILRFPDLLNKSYRMIADEAGIALGNIGGLLKELTVEGFLKIGNTNEDKNYFIENQNRLIERWAEAYKSNLRPKQLVGNFRFLDKETVKAWKAIPKEDFNWGGENAGALLTKFLQPEKFTIYTLENRAKLMKSLKLVPDIDGNVEILTQFWKSEGIDIGVVPPLLAYADLITSFDSRNQETADRIKTQHLE